MIKEGIVSLHKKFKTHKLKCSEVVEDVLFTIKQSPLNSYITVFEEWSKNRAQQIDREKKFPHLLTGIPIAIKDNICVKNYPTTCGSLILKNFIPPYNATAVEKLLKVGAIIIGKTNLDEFAMGSSTETSCFGPTHNPISYDYTAGGSSGGSASSVANCETIVALGTDTGGSVRQPASFCGVVGLKPTYGRVSRYGLVAYASSLDQIGIIARKVEDCAIVLEVIAGRDEKDSTSSEVKVERYFNQLKFGVKGVKVGLPKEYFEECAEEGVKELVLDGVRLLEKEGAKIKEISLPYTKYAIPIYYLIATAEASANLARYDGVKYGYKVEERDIKTMYKKVRGKGFGEEVKRRIMLGTFGLKAGYFEEYYLQAVKARNVIIKEFGQAFEEVDVIITPIYPTKVFKLGEKISNPLELYLSDIFTVTINLAGLPAIALKCGEIDGLPVGFQVVGRRFDESRVLRVAYTYEKL